MQHESAGGRGPARVLLVGEDPRAATMIVEMLRDAWPSGLLVTQTAAVADAQHELADHGDSGVLLDLSGAGDDLDPLRALVAAAPEAAIVVVSDRDDESLGVAAVNAGAQDHLLRSELRPALLTRALRYALERKRAEVRLAQQALEDPLTGLPNRTLFLDRVGVALDRSRRTGLAPAVMFLDVDSFKGVNDSLGHAAGDRLLRTLSQRFQALLRPMDTVARLGGDEFVFLFEGVSGHEEATAIARRIGEAASEPVALGAGPGETSVGASVGFAMLDDPAMAPEDALGNADTAMYRAKALGGGRAEMFDDGPTDDDGGRVRGAARLALADADPDADPQLDSGPDALVADDELVAAGAGPSTITRPRTAPARWEEQTLRDAVHAGRLRVHYQPRVSIDGRTGLVGFEALVRLDDPERGLVVPAEFMAAAQDSDLIVEIDDVVLDEALRQVRRWRQSRPGVTVSVNISPRQLADPELPERLRARLRETDTDPSVLWLEIPDSAIRRDPELAAIAFARLSEIGVALAIDDYRGDHGADHLRDLPVEMLKIDPAVVARLENPSARDEELLETIVELGHELGLSVVAEGIETDHQLAWIRDLRCDGAQGYLFSRPVPEESVHELLGVG